MAITISFQNEGGELDSRTAKTAKKAAEALVSMVEEAGEVYGGDKFVISGDEDE